MYPLPSITVTVKYDWSIDTQKKCVSWSVNSLRWWHMWMGIWLVVFPFEFDYQSLKALPCQISHFLRCTYFVRIFSFVYRWPPDKIKVWWNFWLEWNVNGSTQQSSLSRLYVSVTYTQTCNIGMCVTWTIKHNVSHFSLYIPNCGTIECLYVIECSNYNGWGHWLRCNRISSK